jgi:drug/metabolite transporter (DMT)-like permease
MLLAKVAVVETHPNILVLFRVGVGGIVVAVWAAITGKANFDLSPSAWIIIFAGAFLGEYMAWLMFYRSYRHWNLSHTSVVRTVEPLFVLVLAFLILHSLPNRAELLGGMTILVGAAWLAWIHLSKPNGQPGEPDS